MEHCYKCNVELTSEECEYSEEMYEDYGYLCFDCVGSYSFCQSCGALYEIGDRNDMYRDEMCGNCYSVEFGGHDQDAWDRSEFYWKDK